MLARLIFRMLGISVLALGSQAVLASTQFDSWSCVGTCGDLGANGVVTTSPLGNSQYGYISTNGSSNFGLSPWSGTTAKNGSTITSPVFSGSAGQALKFYFNYVTSDGSGYTDFAWANLLSGSSISAVLLTAKTEPSGTIIPGNGLPTPVATLSPPSVPIIPGGPSWAPLGSYSGKCWAAGCGYTGWVEAFYTIPTTGTYQLQFGVVNANDTAFDSGLAFDGASIGGTTIGSPVPEPQTYAMLLAGLGLIGFVTYRRKNGSSIMLMAA